MTLPITPETKVGALLDAYPALEAAGAQLRTGPTGTNVNDLTVVLVTG